MQILRWHSLTGTRDCADIPCCLLGKVITDGGAGETRGDNIKQKLKQYWEKGAKNNEINETLLHFDPVQAILILYEP